MIASNTTSNFFSTYDFDYNNIFPTILAHTNIRLSILLHSMLI